MSYDWFCGDSGCPITTVFPTVSLYKRSRQLHSTILNLLDSKINPIMEDPTVLLQLVLLLAKVPINSPANLKVTEKPNLLYGENKLICSLPEIRFSSTEL